MELTQKGEMVERLQVKASSIGRILTNLERKYHNTHDSSDLKKSPSGQLQKCEIIRIQRIPPFNSNKIRKSPSSESQLDEASAAAVASVDVAQDETLQEVSEPNEEQP